MDNGSVIGKTQSDPLKQFKNLQPIDFNGVPNALLNG